MFENIKQSMLDEVKKYWQYANEEDLEGVTVSENGNYTIVNFSVASGQGGVVAIWDDQEKLVHISNAEYGIVSTIYDGNVYTLCGIVHWGHPLSYTMTKIPFGTMDAWKETDEVEGFKLDDEGVYEAFQKGEDIKLEVKADKFVISYGDKTIEIRINELKFENEVKVKRITNQILALQNNTEVYSEGEKIVDKSGSDIKIEKIDLNWNKPLSNLALGKCGELYAQFVFNSIEYDVYETLVDNHGIDLLVKKGDKVLKVQVKTVRDKNYTFIKKGNPIIDNSFYLFYIRVENGVPNAYFFPMNSIIERFENGKFECFSDRGYGEGKKSKPEYGVSAADTYFKNGKMEEYCVAKGWSLMENCSEKIEKIININNTIDKMI